MNEQLEELACLYVLDQLDERERADFAARLPREPELAAFVQGLESTLAHGVRTLPQTPTPADLLDRIEATIDAETGQARPASFAKASEAREAARHRASPAGGFGWAPVARWGLAAVIAVSLATLAVQSLRRSSAPPAIVFVGLDLDRNTFAELRLRESPPDPDARFIQLAGLAENFWDQPGSLPVKPRPTAGESRGFALFDPGSQQGFIAIEQIPALAGNQRYHLWVVDPATGRVSDAGILPLAGTNRGLYSFALEPADRSKSNRPGFFITAEDNGATPSAEPRGKVVLGHRSD